MSHTSGGASDRGLATEAGVVIIGGGVMGTSIAFHLAEAGVRDVVLLEKGDLGGGSTCRAAGGVRAQFSDPINISLGLRGLAAFEDFPQRPGQEIDLRQPGYLFLLTDEQQVLAYEASVALQNSMGVPTRMLTPAQAADLNPVLDVSDVLAAAWHPRDGYCSPESVVLGYASAARRMGVTIRTGTAVTGIDVIDGEVAGVRTDDGIIRTRTVICAAGAWSREIGAMAGIDLPVEPLRRQILVTEPLRGALADAITHETPMSIDAASTFYFHREGPGVLLGMSFTGEEPGFRWDYSTAWLGDLGEAMERRAPALLDVGIAHRWVGMYEVTPDHNALLGASSTISGLLYACGFSGHGFLQGPAVGEVMRDLYLGREPFVDVTGFRVERFAEGTLRPELSIV